MGIFPPWRESKYGNSEQFSLLYTFQNIILTDYMLFPLTHLVPVLLASKDPHSIAMLHMCLGIFPMSFSTEILAFPCASYFFLPLLVLWLY